MNIIHVDANRFLIREASLQKISGKWMQIVDEIIETCKVHLGSHIVSIYVGGSVAHGCAIENKSDVDTYAIVDLNKEELDNLYDIWVERERKRIDRMFPFQRGVEIHLVSKNHMSEGRKFQMKVLSALVYGKDFDTELPKYKLDRETLGRIRVNVGKDIEMATKEIQETDDSREIIRICAWISKRLIRSAGMTCMWKGDIFTMDVAVLMDVATANYPDKKVEISRLLEYTENPISSKIEIVDILNTFGMWLVEEDRKVFHL